MRFVLRVDRLCLVLALRVRRTDVNARDLPVKWRCHSDHRASPVELTFVFDRSIVGILPATTKIDGVDEACSLRSSVLPSSGSRVDSSVEKVEQLERARSCQES